MNYRLVCKLQSIILGALAAAFALSFLVSWLNEGGPNTNSEAGMLYSTLVTALCAVVLYIIGRRGSNIMFRKEALAVIGIGWIVASVFGALPYYLVLPEVSFPSAIFEAASGFTTTGASILDNLESLPKGVLFWRALSQWIGGLGVVVFFVAVLSFLGAGAKVLFSRESSAQAAELDAARVQQGVMRLLLLYLGISALCAMSFKLCGLSIYDAVCHMFATVATGGFSTRTASIAAYNNPALEWAVILFMAIGGTSLIPVLRMLRGDWQAVTRSTEIRCYYAIILVASVITTLFLLLDSTNTLEGVDRFRTAMFQVVSLLTTTGFITADFDQWLPVTHVLFLVLMTIGGCTGSTAGGAKVIRMLIASKICLIHIEKAYRARVVRTLQIDRQHIDTSAQESVLVFLILLGMVAMIGTILVSLLEPGVSLEGSISAMAACLFNIGPGFAEVGPSNNFAGFNDATKLVLSLLMILGRVELFAILALFAPSLWKRF